VFAVLAGKLELALRMDCAFCGKSTLNRLEHTAKIDRNGERDRSRRSLSTGW
jgi:hypothetical protein